MKHIDVISKGTHKILDSKMVANEISLTENSVVIINASIKDILKIERVNNALIIHFKDGEVLRIENYYDDQNTLDNSLVLKEDGGQLIWIQKLENIGVIDNEIHYQILDNVEPLLYNEDGSQYAAALPWLTGGVLVAAIAYHDKDHSQPKTPPHLESPIEITAYTDDAGNKKGVFDITVPTDDTTPSFVVGTYEDNLTPILYVDGIEVASKYDRETGLLTPEEPLSEGEHLISYGVKDKDGNLSDPCSPAQLVIDTTPPDKPDSITNYVDDVGSIKEKFSFETVTDDTTPSFIIGTIPDDETITLYVDGKPVESTYDKDKGTLTPKVPLSEGDHEISYSLTDEVGNESELSEPVVITVDTTAPGEVVITDVQDNEINLTGPLTSGGYTNDTKPTLSGSGAEPNALITLKDENGKVLGTAIADEDGTWRVEPTDANKLSDGPHTLNVTQTDKAGNESPADSFDVIVDTQAPSQITVITDIQDNEGAKTGLVSNNGYTDDLSPSINGTISAALGANEKVVIYRDGKYLGEASIDPNNPKVWHYQDKELENGKPYQYTARVEDSAGNRGGDSNTYNITIDNDPPPQTISISSMTDNVAPVQGDFASGVTTDDSTPQLNGSLSQPLAANEYIVIYRDGVQINTVTVAAGSTTWSYTDGGLTNNTSYTYTAKIEDGSGLQSAASNEFNLTFKNDGSSNTGTITGVYDDVAPYIGNIDKNGTTNDTTPLLQGSLTDPLAAGEKVAVYRGVGEGDRVKIGEATVDATGKGWSYQDHDLVNGEKYTYSVAVETAAGKPGAESTSYTINIDTLPPSQTIFIDSVYDNKTPVIGTVENGGVTNDDTPEIKGHLNNALNAGESVFVYRDEQYIGTATVNADNTWSYIDSSLGSGQTYLYTAKVVDLASNESSVSNGYSITTNFDDPPQTIKIIRVMDNVEPQTGEVSNNGTTNDATPRLEGSIDSALSAGDEIIISCNGAEIGTATVQNATQWYYEGPLVGDATYTYTAVIRNSAGVDGAPSNSYTITLDTAPPPATSNIYSYTDDVAPQTGEFLSGSKSNDTSPTLNISVTGTLAIGDVVAVYRDGVKIGNASLSGGVYRYTDNGALQDGHSYKYTTCIEDAAGNKGTFSSEFIISIDTVPASAVQIDEVIDDQINLTGPLSSGDYTNDTKPTFNGSGAEAGALISLKDENGKVIGTTVADAKGEWSVEPSDANKLSDGLHSLTVTQTDAAGNESPADSFDVIVDTQAPSQITVITDIQDNEGAKTGLVSNNGYTDDLSPSINGTISAALGANEKVVIYRDGKYLGEASIDPNNPKVWHYQDKELENGKPYQYTARVEDSAGNRGGDSNTYNITIDNDPPPQTISISSMTDNVAPVQGDFASGVTTDDSTPQLNGSLSQPLAANEYIVIYRDGVQINTVTVAAGSTTWSYTDGGLTNNTSYTYTAKIEDGSGLQSAASNEFNLTFKNDGSSNTGTITGVYDDVAPYIGNIDKNGTTNDTTPLLQGSLTDPLAAGEKVAVYRGVGEGDRVKIGEATVDATGKGWSYQDHDLVNGEKYTYSVAVETAAGKPGAESTSYTINIDTLPPSQTIFIDSVYDNKTPVIGTVENGGVTNDDTPEIKGHLNNALNAGESVFVYRDEQYIGTATVNADNTWSYIDSSLGSGQTYLYTAKVVDLASNESSVSNGYSITTNFDDPPQTIKIIRVMDNVEPQTGEVSNNGTTNDATPRLEGSIDSALSAGDEIIISCNGAEIGTATVQNATQWYYEGPLVGDATYTYTAVIRNSAGVDGAPSNSYTITLDTAPPPATSNIYSYTDDVAPQTGEFLSGSKSNDTSPTLNISVTGTLAIGDVVAVYRDGVKIGNASLSGGVYRYTDNGALQDGHSYKYTTCIEDAAGNKGTFSSEFIISIDTVPASAVQIDEVIDDQINLTGPLSSGDYTNDTKPTFNGSGAEAGALISLKDENGKVIGTTVADAKGEWSVEPSDANKLSDGLHSLTVTQTDAAGNESPADSFDVIVDTQAPSQITVITDIQDNEGAKTGLVSNNGYTDDLSPSINGTISAALGANEKVVIYRDGKYLGEASIDPNNPKVWHYQDKELENGKPYQYTARVEDSAGNRGGDSNTYNITIDNDPPPQTISISSMTDNVAPVQGDFASGVTTDDSTPQLNGSLSQPLAANEYIVIYRDGVQINTVTVAAGSTTWSYTDGGLTNNTSYTYTAKIEDGSGLQSAASNEFNLTFKNDGSSNTGTITGVYDDVAPYIGNIDKNGTTNDTTPLLQGSLTDPLAAGEKVAVYRGVGEGDRVKIGEATVDATGKGWSYQDHDLVNGEKYTYSVAVETAAGKPGAESTSYTINIDTLPPSQTIFIDSVYDNKTPVIGTVENGGVTNDDTPEIKGHLNNALNAGESVFVYRDEQYIGTATVNADNTWSYIDSSLGSGQTYLYTAKVVDLASNESSVSNGYSITTNFDDPPQTIKIIRVMDNVEPQTGEVSNNGTTNDATPRLEGSIDSALSAGDEIIISCNGAEIGTATVQNATQWYYEGPLVGDATYTYTAVIRNSAGVDGAPSNSYTITLDTAPPPATSNIYSYTDDVAPQTGEFLSGSKSNDTSPTLNISVTGTLAIGDVVAVYRDGVKIGNASLSGGVYRYTDNGALQDGHSYKYTTCIEDAAGNKGTFSSEFIISIDTVPASAVQIDEVIDDQINLTGPLSSGDYTNDTKPTFNGSGAEAGALISLKDENGKVIGTTVADAKGEWSVEPSDANKLSDGLHSLTVTQTDAAGNESPADSFDVIVDTQAPSQITVITDIQDNEGAKTGLVSNNGYTDDLSPSINGTISAALGANEKVVIYRDGKYLGEASIDPNNPKVWHYQDKELENGKPYQYTARVEDSAGNRGGDSNTYNITIDNDPPPQTISISSMTDNVAPVQGDFASGVTTDDSTPQLNGSLSQPLAANEYIVIYRDGVQINTVTVAAGSTTWSYTDGGLTNNTSYTYTAKIEDGSGLQSAASNEFNLTFKNDGSSNTGTITGVYDDVAPYIGNIDKNGTTNDTTPLLQGSLTDPLAAGEKVAVYRGVGEGDRVKIGEATVDATGKGWSYQDHDLVNGEKYTYSVAVETAAGKPGAESTSYTISIDTLPPSQTIFIDSVYDNKTPVIGTVENGGVTNDDTPEIKGHLNNALNAGESVFVYRDEQYIGTATVNADNTWSYIDSSLGSGQTYLYTAKVVDLASNESSVSNGYSITTNFDDPPQTIKIIRVMDNVEPQTGEVSNNGTTNDATPRLEGSIDSALSAGDEIIISCNGAEIGTATVQNATQWYYEGLLVGDATYTYTAVIRNSAGVDGAPSNSYTITLDTAPPPATSNIYSYTDDVAPQTGEFLSGSKSNDTSPTLNISVTGTLAIGDVVAVYRDGVKIGNASLSGGVYRYTDNGALQDGHSYKYTTCIEDAAGNKGTFSSEFIISIDTVPASAVQIDEVIDDQINLTGPLSSGDYTNDTKPTFNGSGAEAGALISLKDENGKVIGTTVADAKGEWSVEPSDANKLSDGLHSLTVTQTDAAGNESPADSFDVIVDTQAPSQITVITDIQDNEGAKTGLVSNNGYTDDLSPSINGTISAALGANEKVVIYRDGKYLGEASIDPNNPKVWHYQDKELENGKPYQYTARVEDSAGNRGGDSNTYNITIDNDPPPQTISISSMTDNVAPVQGDFASGVTTDDSTPQLNGSLSQPLAANEYIVIYRDGVQINTVTVAAGSTTWSYTDGGLTNNTSYTYTAKIEDGSGLQSAASNEFNLTFKNDGSSNTGTITGVYDDVAPYIGNIDKNGTTNDTTPLLQGSLTDPLAAGEKVAVYRGVGEGDRVKIGEATVDATGKGWSYQDHDLVNGEKYTYSVAVETAAGKPGAESTSYTINIDTLPPSQTIFIDSVYDNKTPVIGTVENGGVTNDDTPEIKGHLNNALNAGESVFVYRDEQYIGTATVNADNTWSYIDSSLGSGQTYLYTAKVVDLASNESSVSNGYSITTNFDDPPQTIKIIRVMDNVEPQTGEVSNNGTTNDATPRLEGSIDSALSAGDEIIISCNGAEIGTATVQNATQWYYEGPLVGDATYTYTAVIRNSAGVDGAPSNSYTITLDTAPPPATSNIYSYTDDVAPQTGEFLSGSKSNDTSPTLNISVTGTLAIGDVVAVYRDGVKIGNASLSGGVYRYTDNSALQDGHSYKYTTCIEDAAGNKGKFSSEFIISIDLIPPPPPIDPIKSYIDDVGEKTGTFAINEVTDDKKPDFIIPKLDAGEKANLYIDGNKVDVIYDPATGTLTPVNELTNGDHKLTYTVVDTAGNESVQSPESIITILSGDNPPPPKPTQYVDDVDPVQGTFGTGTSTNDTTPGVIIGTVPAGNTPALYVDGVKVEASYDPVAGTLTPKNPLLEGEHNITYTLTNPAGNESPKSDPIKVIVDTTPPDQPVATKYLDNVDPIQGEFGTGTLTNDATPGIIIGTVPAGETPTLYVDGVKVEADYDPVAKTLTPKTSLPDGEHNLSYTLTDQAGNESLKSDPIKVIVDASPIDQPTTPTQYVDNVDPVQGTFGTGTSTNDAMPSVIIGAVPVGNTPSLYVDGNSVESVYDPVTSTLTPKVPLGEGEHNLSYTLTNPTGTESPKSDPIKIIVDITAPDQPTIPTQYLDNVDPNQGAFATGTQTNDATPSVVIGVVPEGETPKLYVDGQPVESVYDAVEGTLTPKEPLADGEHNLSYTLTDPAGNESVQSDPIKVIIDTVPPDQPNAPTQYIDDKDPQTGTFDTDTPTNDPTPSIIIDPLKDGETAILYVDDKPVESIYDAEKGTLTPIDPLDEGSHDITYSVVDVAGNESLQSDPDHPLTIVIDTIVPDVLTITSFTDNWGNNQGTYSDFVNTYTNDRTPTLNGTSAEPGALITLKDETNKVLGTAIADINGQWSITPTDDNTLDRGEYQKTLYVTETDKAGNVSAETKCVLNIDTFAYAGTQTLTTITDILGNVIKPNSIIDPTTLLVISGTIEIPLAANEKVLLMPDKFDSSYGVEVTMLTATTWTVTIDPMNFRMQQSDSDMGFINFMARVVDAAGNDSGDTRAYPIKFDLTQTSDEMITPRALLLDSELTTTNVDNNVDNKELISNVIPQTFNFTRTLQMGVMMADNLAAITGIRDDKEPLITTVLNNGYTDDTTPLLEGSLTSSLSTGETVGVYRDGVKIGTAEVSGTTWSYQDSGLLNGNQYKYTVAVENSMGVKGTESDIYLINVDNGVSDANVISQDESVNIFARDAGLSQVITITEIYDNKGPGIGVIAEGNVTNDDLPEIRGSLSQPLATGEAVYILRNGVEVGEATVTGTEWTFEDGGLGSRQAYTYTAIIKDIDGNIISTSNIYAIQTNFDDPDDFISINYVNDNVSPITGLVDHNGYTNDTTPTVEGVLKLSVSYDKLVVYRDGLEVGEATVQGDTWKFADDLSLSSQGEHKYQVKAFDGTTEVSTSNEFIINFDTVAPSATITITSYHDDISPLTGDFLSNSSTNDTSPTLNLKVNGVIGSNESVYVYRDGQYIGKATLVSGSDYQFIDNSLEDGQTYTYTTRVVDAAGNAGVLSSEFNITVDLTPPAQPVAPMEYIDDIGSIQGTFGTDTVTDDTKPALKIGITDETPTLYVDGVKVAATYDPVEGTLTPVTALTDGSHDLSYTLTDAAGNESIESEAVTVIVDTVPPVQPVSPSEYIDNVDPLAGTFVTDTTTNDTTPSLIIGAVAVDETPTLYVDGQAIDSVYDAVNGTLTPVSALGDGSHDLSYTLTDIAGNESLPSDSITVIVDTVPPTATASIKSYTDDVGAYVGDFLKNTTTDDLAPTLNINVNQVIGADEVVQVFRDGVYIGTATLVANKKYQFTDDTGGLVDGKTYKYSTCVVDAAGNQGTMSGNFKITIDLTPPDQPDEPTLFIDDQGALQGTFGSGTFTDDTHPGVIIAPITTNETPTLYVDGQKVESTYDPLNNTLTPVQALAEGSHQVTYTVSDAAGNESVESNPIEIIVDTTPPDQPDAPLQYVDNVGLSQGVFVSDTETDDTTPGIIIGNIPTNETPTLYVDGQKVDSIYDPVAQTLTPVTALDDGTHNFTYTLTDAASNESAQSEPIVITIDTLPPAVTGISTTMVLSVDTADGVTDAGYTSTITASNQDLITRDNTPEYVTGVLSNALNAGEMLQISKDGGVTWEDVTILSGVNWSYRFNDVYSTDTTLEFAFRVRDNASNYSELDNQNRTVTIDLTGPNTISVQPKLAALLDTKTTYTFSSSQYGTAEPGTKIALINDVNNNGMWQEGLDKVIAYAIVDANGQWTISTKLPAGDLTLGFMVWDKAGNISDLSPTTSTEVKSGGESSNNAGFEVLATNWGGTTDGEGYGVNCAAVTVNADGSYSFWQSVRGTNGTKTANAGRVYSATDLYSYTSTYLAQASKTNGAGYNVDNCCYGQFVSSAVFADINRDGNADVMSQLSSYGNCGYTSYWMNNGDGTYSAKAFYQGTLNHLGGVIAYDRTGDGYLDFVLADSCSDSITFIKNNSGTLTYETSNITCTSNGMPQSAVLTIKNGLGTASVTGAAIPKDLSILHDVAGVDLDNNGTIDIVAHVDYNGTKLYGDCSRGMGVLYNSGTSAGFTYINNANIFTSDGGTDYGNLQQSIVFADYNGDGWLDMFISRGSKGGCDSNESRIYLNDGTGKLNASDTQALWFGDSLSGGSAFAVDWNMDGKQDLIEVPAQVSGCAIKTGFAPTLYLNTGNDVWGKNALAMTTSKYTDITGATAVDYDWDGAVDLVLYRAGTDAGVVASGNNAPSILIRNTGVAADGTSLHVKIVDGQGINCYYGNTVQLYDSKGNLVATQVINAQSSASTDSTGIVNFYGLNPNETYSVQLLRITNGVSNNVSGLSNLGGYANNTINAAWTGLVAGKANEAYVLTAESDTAANNSSNGVGVVGTGYNDHLYASLGNDHYNGGGGWKTNTDGTQSWVANGGADILDYSKVNAQITIDVTAGTVTKVANGAIYKDTFENIEQFVGGKGDTTFTGSSADNIFTSGAGKDTFDITSGGSDTIVFNLLDKADATGGNGSDVVNGFHIGKVGADSNADVINIHDLLSNYSGTAGLYADTDALKLDIASSELNKYLQVTNDGTNTYINVNINGTGHDYATVLTLHDVKTDLLTLLANNQLVI